MANRIPEEVVNDIRQQTDIATVVGQYVQLRKSGKNLFGVCPFHEEKTPSFSVSEDKQIFHCFSCGRGGNVFNFIMEIDGLNFPEAVLKVAEMENIKLPVAVTTQVAETVVVNPIIRAQKELHQQAKTLYHHILMNTVTGEEALAYLHERGMSDETINLFELGFAPAEGNVLHDFLQEQKADYDDMRKSGLFNERDDGQLQDRFFGRIMFPVKNVNAEVIGFSGRVLVKQDNVPKYLNSPETQLFNKRDILYNFDLAKKTMRQTKQAILFEGFMDVISAYVSGVTNGIASMGTSLTDSQVQQLSRQVNEVIISYDGDDAGVEATKRAIKMLTQLQKLTVGIVALPEGLDPDEYTQKYGADKFKALYKNGVETPTAFELNYLKRQFNLANEKGKLDYADAALAEIAKLKDPLEREIYLEQLASQLTLDKNILSSHLAELDLENRQAKDRASRRTQSIVQDTPQKKVQYSQAEKAERLILSFLFHDDSILITLKNDAQFHFIHEDYETLMHLYEGFLLANEDINMSAFLDFLPDDHFRQIVSEIEMMEIPDNLTPEVLNDYLAVIASQSLISEIKEKQQRIIEAKRLGDTMLEMTLTKDVIQLTRQLKL